MAEIAPFAGIRYDPGVVADLAKVVSPPYDVISPEDRVYYHSLDPHNVVRLILGEELPEDDDTNNRFSRACGYLERWLSEGVLKRDTRPALYVCRQQFEHGGPRTVRGFTCAVRLHDYADGVILPHENTLARPKSQLAQLIRSTRANLDSVYGLYADENRALDPVLDRVVSGEPAADVRDRDGVRHSLWVMDDETDTAAVVRFMLERPIAIADGHHRYETALAYSREMRNACPDTGVELSSDYVLMTLINVYEEDMTVFPTHRVVAALPDDVVRDLPAKLERHFEVAGSSRVALISDMAARRAIGIYRAGDARTAAARPQAASSLGDGPVDSLELSALHRLILEAELGIDDEKLRNQTHIVYTRDAQEAMDLVDSGERQVAFLLNEIPVKSVLDVAQAGEKMPQKATYFYPKLLSGLVLRSLE